MFGQGEHSCSNQECKQILKLPTLKCTWHQTRKRWAVGRAPFLAGGISSGGAQMRILTSTYARKGTFYLCDGICVESLLCTYLPLYLKHLKQLTTPLWKLFILELRDFDPSDFLSLFYFLSIPLSNFFFRCFWNFFFFANVQIMVLITLSGRGFLN